MYFKNRISVNIPIEKEEKGFIERYLPFFAEILGKKDMRILPILTRTGQVFGDIGMSDEMRLEVNGDLVSGSRNCRDNFQESLAAIQEYGKSVRKIHLVARKKEKDLEITSIVKIELVPDDDLASVVIENHGMVQIPPTVNAKTFAEDVREQLEKGYLEKCEKSFKEFADSMARSFKNAFQVEPVASKIEKTVIVPAKKDLKTSKLYNRKFSDESRVCSPAFYNSTGVSPEYSYKGYTDPYEIWWWMMMFDYSNASSGGNENFMDSRGNEISKHDANVLVNNTDQSYLSRDLAGSSPDFSSGKYETFPESVEASRFDSIDSGHDKDDEHNKNSSTSDNSAAFVAGDGGGSHTNSTSHTTSHDSPPSSCGGNHSSCSSCSGGSSCGGGGCGGGGCGGGGCGGG
jgi:hypothetical protein